MKNFTAADKLALWQALDTGELVAYSTRGSVYQNLILSDNPIAYWPLNETSGTTVHDISGNNYNGTYQGGYTLDQSAQTTISTKFDGSTGFALINTIPPVPTTGLTLEAWVNILGYNANNPGSSTGVSIIDASDDGNSGFDLTVDQTNGIWFWHKNTNNQDSKQGSPVSSGWHHIVATESTSAEVTLYLDGKIVFSGNDTTYGLTSSGYLKIGHQSWTGGWMNGYISDVAYYGTVLTATKVDSHYQSVATPTGWQEYYREVNGNLVEIIYTKAAPDGDFSTIPAQSL